MNQVSTHTDIGDLAVRSRQEAVRPLPRLWAGAQRGLAAALLLFLLPLLGILYPLIRLTSRGPFIYRQTRPGLDRKLFTAYKIRTMYQSADRDSRLARSVNSSSPQVTSIGRVLRDLKLDELPQLWNIVRGDMNFVGPRPIAQPLQRELEGVIPGFASRLQVRPGLTNLGQVCILESAEQERVVHDWGLRFQAEKHYLANRSTAYDFLIIGLTFLYIFRKLIRRIGVRPAGAVAQ